MDKLMILDLSLLVIFLLFVGIFLYKNRKKLQKDGWLFLYRTKWGLRLIKNTGKKYKKTIKFLSYISISLGYILMAGIIWMFARIVYVYVSQPQIVQAIKVPPIAPLIPYLPQIFKLDFLPNFYFIYWIVILAVIAITHEFFHGIFASANDIKTKKTGFGFFPFFFPIFMAAFVELDEKVMQKKSIFAQKSVLSAGTFANILTAILGVFLLWGIVAVGYTPSGVVFDDYAYANVNTSHVNYVNGIQLENPSYEEISPLINESGLNDIRVGEHRFTKIRGISKDESILQLYYNASALNQKVYGPIIKINNEKIKNLNEFSKELKKYQTGDKINLTTFVNEKTKNYEITLNENPQSGEPWIGIVFYEQQSGFIAKIASVTTTFKEPHVYYHPKTLTYEFIYNLLWWLILISFSVALINMLPMGIFDGGRFFYLTVLKITKSEKKAEKAFKYITWFFLFFVILIMVYWFKGIL
jgi:membrane-associated protease RseP (regulator of RpoE activity)